jgi:acyl-CoA-dependent ceramide synthase
VQICPDFYHTIRNRSPCVYTLIVKTLQAQSRTLFTATINRQSMTNYTATPCQPDVTWNTGQNAKGGVGAKKLRKTKRAEDDSLVNYLCTLVCNHQLGTLLWERARSAVNRGELTDLCTAIATNLLLLLTLTHIFFPRARRRTSKFFTFSYYNPSTGQYGCGIDDLHMVALWIVLFTGARVVVMDHILKPLARMGGIKTRKGMVRFQEQAWLVCYCMCSWSLGMVRMSPCSME